MDAQVAQLRNRRAVYPFDMFGDFATNVAPAVEHYLRKHHPVKRLAVFEGKEYRSD